MTRVKIKSNLSIYLSLTSEQRGEVLRDFSVGKDGLVGVEEVTMETPIIQPQQVSFTERATVIPLTMIGKYKNSFDIDTSPLSDAIKVKWSDEEPFPLLDYQKNDVSTIMKHPFGQVCLPTGYGKTSIMAYLAYKYCKANEGNVVVIAPNYAVITEILSRMSPEISDRVIPLHCSGFLAGTSGSGILEKLNDVTLMLVDEAESVTKSLLLVTKNFLPNCFRRYGFSASSNKDTGERITFHERLPEDSFRLLCFFGPAIVYRFPDRSVRIHTKNFKLRGTYRHKSNYILEVRHSMTHPKVIPVFKKWIDHNEGIMYIPMPSKEIGECLLGQLKCFNCATWSSKGFDFNYNNESEDIKEEASSGRLKVIIGTSLTYRGIDIEEITGSIVSVGAKFSDPFQIIGRSFRTKKVPNIYMYSSGLPMFDSAYQKRLKLMSTKLNVLEFRVW